MVWIIKCKNTTVTDYYLEVIKSAIKKTTEVMTVNNINQAFTGNKNDFYIVSTIIDALMLYLKEKKKILIWVQGVVPEESYMRNKNIARKIILEKIERYVLKHAKFVFFVSSEMKKYYELKYGLSFTDRCYIMPCFNTGIRKNAFYKKGKYENNIFAYVGSLSVWQKFDETVRCYKSIEDLGFPNTKLLVLTPDIENARKILIDLQIQNYEVDYVNNEILHDKLSDVKFGFIIRDDIVVNQVATPTKISSYLSCGVIPIYSTCLKDFHRASKDIRYKIPTIQMNFMKNTIIHARKSRYRKDI